MELEDDRDVSARGVVLMDPTAIEDPFLNLKSCSVVTYSDAALLRIPWSALGSKGDEDRRPSPINAAPPGPFEHSVFRALEWIAIDSSVVQGRPLKDSLVLHPRDLCERLCWHNTQVQYEAIERALVRLAKIEVPADPAPRRLLRAVVPGDRRTLTKGMGFPPCVVHFDRDFIDSVNAGRLHPINWGLWVALREPASRRLLEIVDTEFGAFDAPASISISYAKLSSLIALPREFRKGHAMLERSNAELIRRGYLEKVRARGGRYEYLPGVTFHALHYRLERHESFRSFRRLARKTPRLEALERIPHIA